MSTVADVFSHLGLAQWWTIQPTQTFGGKANGEWGEDFPMPPGTRVGSVTEGKVVYVGQPNPGSSIGYVVQVEAPDGTLTHYQHLQSATVKENDHVGPGDVVGLSGGCPTGAYTKSGCKWTDANSTGPHIEVRRATGYSPSAGVWYQPWVNPASDWNPLAKAGADLVASPGSSGGSTGSTGTPDTVVNISSSCTHSINFPGVAGQGAFSICLDAGLQLLIRGGLIIGGVIFILAAILIFAAGNSGVQAAASDAAKLA